MSHVPRPTSHVPRPTSLFFLIAIQALSQRLTLFINTVAELHTCFRVFVIRTTAFAVSAKSMRMDGVYIPEENRNSDYGEEHPAEEPYGKIPGAGFGFGPHVHFKGKDEFQPVVVPAKQVDIGQHH